MQIRLRMQSGWSTIDLSADSGLPLGDLIGPSVKDRRMFPPSKKFVSQDGLSRDHQKSIRLASLAAQ